ncbi:M-phase inducer phosphatase 3-like [Brevipalpus obovatus]|uniref:M-phase inducer phosphatase 3-like n=1 Tax=Brevipalpus obovatus TaxID=246614 RepID=UPI003D9F8C90
MDQPTLFAFGFKKPAPDGELIDKDKRATRSSGKSTPIRISEKANLNMSVTSDGGDGPLALFQNDNGSNKAEKENSLNISTLRLFTPSKDCDTGKSEVAEGNSSIHATNEGVKGNDSGESPILKSSTSKRRLRDQCQTPKRARVESGSDDELTHDADKRSNAVSSKEINSESIGEVGQLYDEDERLKSKKANTNDLKASIVCPAIEIIDALQKSDSDPNLIGDYSRPHQLPIIKGRHGDLQSISPGTLASLINGHFKDRVASFKIIDSRFPYEFEGGHIKGAINIFHKSALIQELLSDQENTPPICSKDSKSNQILIFHCEFSSERAPSLCRFLRSKDREFNGARYPQLYHPEMYLLEGGYKAFFESHQELCTPQQYLPMRSKDHQEQMRTCQSKRKKMEKEASKYSSKFKNRS